MNYKKPQVVAEIGCNHMGQFEIAKELIKLAKECGANVAKFQKRTPEELLTKEQFNAPHPNPSNSFGNTYGEHRNYLEFTIDKHYDLKKYCESLGIEYSTSVWDNTSAREVIELNPSFIKVPSACNNNFEMLSLLRDTYKGEVHISTGMTLLNEIESIVSFFKAKAQNKRLIIYSCTSGYPVPFEDICLLEISRLSSAYGQSVNSIGFSGHHLGIAIDVAAYTLGASWIERHFTKDRTWKGTDHAASLEPSGLSKLIRNLQATYTSLRYKEKEILDIEEIQRQKLKYRK